MSELTADGVRDACREWAVQRFDEYGPMDARGAALWDVAAWIDENAPQEPHNRPLSYSDGLDDRLVLPHSQHGLNLPPAIRQAIQEQLDRPSYFDQFASEHDGSGEAAREAGR